MEHPLINSADPLVSEFLDDWFGHAPYIHARTSGSTGDPKVIRLSKTDMKRSASATLQFLGIGRGAKMALPLSVNYIAGKMMIVRALQSGSALDVETPSNRPLADRPASAVYDLVAIVPSQIEGLLSASCIRGVRNLIVGGAPMTSAQERMLVDAGIKAYATYGMTETCSHVAMRRAGEDIYRAMPGITFAVDSDGALIIDAPDFDFATIATNDIVELESPASFRWLGRRDNVINSGGIKIFPEQLEQAIARLDGAPELFYISSRESDKWGREVVMVIIGQPADTSLLQAGMKKSLPGRYLPKAIIFDPNPRYTLSGKLVRHRDVSRIC